MVRSDIYLMSPLPTSKYRTGLEFQFIRPLAAQSLLLDYIDPLTAKTITSLTLATSSLSPQVGLLRRFRKSPRKAEPPSCSKAQLKESPFLFPTSQA